VAKDREMLFVNYVLLRLARILLVTDQSEHVSATVGVDHLAVDETSRR